MPIIHPLKEKLVRAALPHVAFDGWSQASFDAAVRDTGTESREAAAVCPRRAVDLAIAFHQMGDAAMVVALQAVDPSGMRFRDKVAEAIRLRLAATEDKEAVRRGSALFSLPHLAPDGARLIWGTADIMWDTLGDTADDINWYTKRATLAGVYGAVVLYWLGDDSLGGQATDDFIDRRINDVMQIEKVKGQVRENPLLKPLMGPLARMMSGIKPPLRNPVSDLPGMWREQG